MEGWDVSNGWIRAAWMKWEAVFHRLWHVEPLGEGKYLFFVSVSRYYGHPFTVDGQRVSRFDRVLELHMNNDMLLEMLQEQKTSIGFAVKLLQETKRSFPVLAKFVAQPRFEEIRVLYGVTFINRSVERFGFYTFPIRSRGLSAITTWYLKKVFAVFNPHGKELMKSHPETFVPRLIAMSREKIIAEYLLKGQGAAVETPVQG